MSDTLLDRLAAENAIRRLVSAYCDAVNRQDADAAGELFAPDAVVKIADFPEFSGREAITEGMRQTFAASGYINQSCDAGLINVEGHRAQSRLSVFETSRKPGEERVGLIYGFYEDKYVRLDGNWRFARRQYNLQFRALVPTDKIQQNPAFIPTFDLRG